HRGADGEAGGVVLGTVDALAGGEALHRRAEHLVGLVRSVGGAQRADVGVNDGHVKSSLVGSCAAGGRWHAAAETQTGTGPADLSPALRGNRVRSRQEIASAPY